MAFILFLTMKKNLGKNTKKIFGICKRNLASFNKVVPSILFAVAPPLETVTVKPMSSIVSGLNNALLALAAGIGIMFLIIGGIRYLRSWGDTEQITKAKNMITYVVLGLVIILVSYSVIVTIDAIIN